MGEESALVIVPDDEVAAAASHDCGHMSHHVFGSLIERTLAINDDNPPGAAERVLVRLMHRPIERVADVAVDLLLQRQHLAV